MRILMSGATGMVGSHLVRELTKKGHKVRALARDPDEAATKIPDAESIIHWDSSKTPSAEAFEDVRAIIHLAGAPISGLWTNTYQKKIYSSRVHGMQNILRGLMNQSGHRVRTIISASAVGYYGNGGGHYLDESSAVGHGFLARVCEDWEASLFSTPVGPVRKVTLRCGLILSRRGGILKMIHTPFRFGLGAILGRGKQWMSWIHLEDVVSAYIEALENTSLEGPCNVTSPHPVRNERFSHSLAETLDRPLFIRVPETALMLLPNNMHQMFLYSQRAIPKKLPGVGFQFRFPVLETCLENIFEEQPETPHKPDIGPKPGPNIEEDREDAQEHYDIDGVSHRPGVTYLGSDKRPVDNRF